MLDVSSLKKAIRHCDEILKQLELHPEDDIIQDAAVQCFEYTYSLTISLLIRFLGECLPTNESVKQMSFQEVIRTANQIGILQKDLNIWLIFREKRNITFHIYNEKKATEVLKYFPCFLEEVRYFLNEITKRNGNRVIL